MKFFDKLDRLFKKASPDLRRRLFGILLVLLLFNGAIWVIAIFSTLTYPVVFGMIALCYGLGLRHAVDADHIAAIDNTTRKLMQDGQKPVAVGFFFSLGHSTIVILLSIIVAISAAFVKQNLPGWQEIGGLIGASVSSIFLLVIGIINLVVLIEIFKTWKQVLKSKNKKEKVNIKAEISNKGIMTRLLSPLIKRIDKSWKMYIVGFLFGLGFDTATEVGLLSIAAASGVSGVPVWYIITLPLAFTAGMVLIDTLDGILMLGAYGWAYVKPIRKLYYNMNITLISVIVALFIGGIEAIQVLSEHLHLQGAFFRFVDNLDFGSLGYLIIAAFIASWFVSILIYKIKGYDKLDY